MLSDTPLAEAMALYNPPPTTMLCDFLLKLGSLEGNGDVPFPEGSHEALATLLAPQIIQEMELHKV